MDSTDSIQKKWLRPAEAMGPLKANWLKAMAQGVDHDPQMFPRRVRAPGSWSRKKADFLPVGCNSCSRGVFAPGKAQHGAQGHQTPFLRAHGHLLQNLGLTCSPSPIHQQLAVNVRLTMLGAGDNGNFPHSGDRWRWNWT